MSGKSGRSAWGFQYWRNIVDDGRGTIAGSGASVYVDSTGCALVPQCWDCCRYTLGEVFYMYISMGWTHLSDHDKIAKHLEFWKGKKS